MAPSLFAFILIASGVAVTTAVDVDLMPKIGFELESPGALLINTKCSPKQKELLKGHKIKDHSGDGWFLGVDTTPLEGAFIQFEYDLLISKPDADLLDKPMKQILSDMERIQSDSSDFELEDSPCNPWKKYVQRDVWTWEAQATGPMMLEGIQDILADTVAGERDALVVWGKGDYWRKYHVLVTKDWFLKSDYLQRLSGASTARDDPLAWVTQDVLGFLSIVLSNAKSAQPLLGDAGNLGAKALLAVMPRTDWSTIYEQVKERIPGGLWDLINHLACYKNSGEGEDRIKGVEQDKEYCSGSESDPVPNRKLESQFWQMHVNPETTKRDDKVELKYQSYLKEFSKRFPEKKIEDLEDDVKDMILETAEYSVETFTQVETLNVKEWVESMEELKKPDALTKFDKLQGSHIGGFGPRLEYAINTKRAVPIWEFRDLGYYEGKVVLPKLQRIVRGFQRLHKKYPNRPW